MKIFVRERLNGYYGVLPFTIANTIASAPFLAFMTVVCTVVVYYLAGLNSDSDRVVYFMINLWLALLVVSAHVCCHQRRKRLRASDSVHQLRRQACNFAWHHWQATVVLTSRFD